MRDISIIYLCGVLFCGAVLLIIFMFLVVVCSDGAIAEIRIVESQLPSSQRIATSVVVEGPAPFRPRPP